MIHEAALVGPKAPDTSLGTDLPSETRDDTEGGRCPPAFGLRALASDA